jgi:hypothetical protein
LKHENSNAVRDMGLLLMMLKEDINVESVRVAEVSGAADGWLVVDDDGAAEWQERGDIVI